MSVMRPGDFLLVQMGHNDQKLTRDGAGPWTTYTAQLKQFKPIRCGFVYSSLVNNN